MNEIAFTPINLADWERGEAFYYYTQMAPTTYTVTVSMDITILRNVLKQKGYKFFPAYLFLVTRAIAGINELRIASKDDVLGYWQNLTPLFPQFHEDNKTTSLLWTEYDDSFQTFYEGYIKNVAKFGDSHGVLSAKGQPPANAYVISCIPWFTFQSFSLHNHGTKDYYLPSLEAGGFTQKNGKIIMPLSITVHHATTDGYHLKLFFEELQSTMNEPNLWL